MEWRPPREVALGILEALFGDTPTGSTGSTGSSPFDGTGPAGWTHPLTPFQAAAVGRLRGIVSRRGGAVLADAVGLGKTYVALALIEERLRAGGDVVVAIPAALRGLWRGPLRRLERAAGDALPVRLVSHAQLSRGVAIRPPRGPGRRLVMVDEAHRFRNPATRRYATLARLMAPAARFPGEAAGPDAGGPPLSPELLLITATPINNALTDLYHLLRLFLPDDALRDAGVPSLRGVFEDPDQAGVRTVVRELVVRRSRGMVDARFGSARAVANAAPVSFPERAPPVIHRYASPGIRDRVAMIEALELAAYGPGAAPLLRLGLLKRLDSSPAALAVSVGRVREFLAAFRDAAAAGRLLRPGDRRVGGDADPFQLLLLGVVADPAPPELDLAALVAATDRDLERLERPGAGGNDAKVEALVALLRSVGERVLVFTEYRDTAEAVWRALLPGFRVARIDGTGAWLGPSPAGRRRVVERFAPAANGRREPPERERVDVLVATDVLAEGLNLQDARHVVSYDLPWNPVRLLQRIGRVDRLGSPHDTVVPHLFVPAEGLDAVLGLTRRLRRKLHGIASVLGEEQADELLEGLAARRADRVEVALRNADGDDEDPLEALRTMWNREETGRERPPSKGAPRSTGPSVRVGDAGERVAEVAARIDVDAIALVAFPDGSCRLFELRRDGTVTGPTPASVRALALALRSQDHGCAPGFAEATGEAAGRATVGAAVARVRRHLRRERVIRAAPAPLGAGQSAARLARRIRHTLAEAGSAADPELVRLADTVLQALATPPPPAQERAILELLDDPHHEPHDHSLTLLVERAAHALDTARSNTARQNESVASAGPDRVRVRAILRVRDPAGRRPGHPADSFSREIK